MPTGTVDDCIQWALNVPESGVFISDSGDNVTGGGVGDVPYVLERLIALDVPSAIYASTVDPTGIDICFRAGVGANVDLSLGGKLDTIHSEPLDVSGRVIALETLRRAIGRPCCGSTKLRR